MSGTESAGRQWGLRLQSAFVLPLARGIYLAIAVGCLLTVIGGALYLAFLQATTVGEPALVPVPPAYEGDAATRGPGERTLDLAVATKRFEPPTKVRFQVASSTLTEPPRVGQVLGYFVAETSNGLGDYPEGVSIIGGPDAELFERVPEGASRKVGLAARPALVEDIGSRLRDLKEATARTFDIRLVARDQFGITSAPMDLSFSLRLAPKVATTAASEPPPELPAQPTELQAVAREIARIVQPEVNPAHFAAYQTALKLPVRCGASDGDGSPFVADYRRALEELRPRLTAANIEAFYGGLCDAWKDALQRHAAEQERAEQQRRAAQRVADAARERARAQNNEAMRQHEGRVARAKAQSTLALSVMGTAFGLFLSLSVVLAFLAIEGHSRAVRAAMESMAALSRGGAGNGSAPDSA